MNYLFTYYPDCCSCGSSSVKKSCNQREAVQFICDECGQEMNWVGAEPGQEMESFGAEPGQEMESFGAEPGQGSTTGEIMSGWQHSTVSVAWIKDITDRRYYFGVIGGGFASAFVGGGYFMAVVDDFGNLVRVEK